MNGTMIGIGGIARRGIEMVQDPELRTALMGCYESPKGVEVCEIGDRLFQQLTSRPWKKEELRRFLNGYRDTHVTALYVAGLNGRILREADESESPEQKALLFRAARQVFEIIPEDTGVDDTPHSELYMEFAEFISGDDLWQLGKHATPQCGVFRRFVKDGRLRKSIEEGILMTAASENWNSGEYTLFDQLIHDWMPHLGLPVDDGKLVYVTVHAGETELGHFLHALEAWRLYCEAYGKKPDPEKAREVFAGYLDQLGIALRSICEGLGI